MAMGAIHKCRKRIIGNAKYLMRVELRLKKQKQKYPGDKVKTIPGNSDI
jgi:hypothetical protein